MRFDCKLATVDSFPVELVGVVRNLGGSWLVILEVSFDSQNSVWKFYFVVIGSQEMVLDKVLIGQFAVCNFC